MSAEIRDVPKEIIAWDLFDTQELKPGITYLRFFQPGNIDKALCNVPKGILSESGTVEFYLGQVRVDILRKEDDSMPQKVWDDLRRKIFEAGFFQLLIEDKYYLQIPLKEVAYVKDVSVPVWQVAIKNILIDLAEFIHDEDWEYRTLTKEKIDFLKNIWYRLHKQEPIHLMGEEQFWAELSWSLPIQMEREVMIRVFLSPLKVRPIV